MIIYDNLKFETQKAMLLYKSYVSFSEVPHTIFYEKNVVTEDFMIKASNKILHDKQMVLLPVYSFPKWI